MSDKPGLKMRKRNGMVQVRIYDECDCEICVLEFTPQQADAVAAKLLNTARQEDSIDVS